MTTEGSGGTRPALDELRDLSRRVEEATDVESLRPLYYRMKSIVERHPDDFEVQFQGDELKKRIAERGAELRDRPSPAPPAPATEPPAAPEAPAVASPLPPAFSAPSPPPAAPPAPPPAAVPASDELSGLLGEPLRSAAPFDAIEPEARIKTTQQQAVTRPELSPPAPPTVKAPESRRRLGRRFSPVAAAALAALATVGFIGLILYLVMGRGGEAGAFAMEFRTFPAGASLRIDRELRGTTNTTVKLPPGDHKIEVILDGYEPVITTITVGPEASPVVELTLTPHPQMVRVYADFTSGEVRLDGEPQGELQDGQLILQAVSMGEHTLEVSSGANRVSFAFELTPAQPPRLAGPIVAQNVLAIVISNAGTDGMAHSSATPVSLSIDGQAAGSIGPQGLPLTGVQPGDHQLKLGSGSDARELVAGFGVNPALTAFLKLDVNAGTLVVVTGEDDVVVSVNGKPQRRRTRNGRLRLPQLSIGQYRVAVSKEGFEHAPEQIVEIRKGAETRAAFEMRPIARMASLEIQGALPEAEVVMDGKPWGAVRTDGVFSVSGVAPGSHLIELRKRGYVPVRVTRSFEAGQAVTLTAADLNFQRAPGTLRLAISPPGAAVTWRPAEGGQVQRVRSNSLSLPEGSYILAAAAEGHASLEARVQVLAGETRDVSLKLDPISKPAGPKILRMEGWEDPSAWTAQGPWHVRRGGGFLGFRVAPAVGTFAFTAKVFRGKRFQWVANYRDARNYVWFEIGRENFFRNEMVNGRARQLLKKEHSLKSPEHYSLTVEISPHALTNKLQVNGQWVTLDRWEDPKTDFTAGRFGVLIENRDQYGLSNFTFTPEP